MSRVAALVALLLWSAAPAAAQSRGVEVFGGYAVVHDAKNDITLPAGWLAGGAVQITRWLSAVADVSGGDRTPRLFCAPRGLRGPRVVGRGPRSARPPPP